MLERIIAFSIHNKLIIILFTASVASFGLFALTQIPIGAVPDITNNQVQVITTSRNLSTQDVEQFITYPVELEMANLPGVKEIRSISKFGLSVVTIVFDDNLGTYLPRQLIAEKIQSATEKIPQGFGTPFMGPISTGLGEIYQYVLDTKPGYGSQYTSMDLRTIQDWIVKRQLSGIPGVVEVNTWGGYLKQYEVTISPERLRSMNLTIVDVFDAIESNNSVAGGGYIEKGQESYFIRGEGLVKSIDDIENIIVRRREGIPIFVKDIAAVNFGFANRFGAITGNGEGEKVLGQVMMLKDANSKEVIDRVKERVAEIQKNLPEGVYINPFLERSELIEKTTMTVAENLIFGCLIVIFVVVLLLGNWRSGLVVASVIPLSLLFAISLMYIFGIDANLMSLGAIDFGIIIDGAVIIVEFIAFQITTKRDTISKLSKGEKVTFIDKVTFEGASKMMNSAIFGQLIILIVFIPILSLKGVEGKMFKPMALTFCFALIGAMIFCFTYIPVVSSMFLKPAKKDRTISDRIMHFVKKMYKPSIDFACAHKRLVLSLSVLLLALSSFIFMRMGGEFVPTLDEGDMVIQPILKTGTSLSETIKTTTKIENILLDNFPEVEQVVSRIGAAEVPTDPMSMEDSDVIIKLKPNDEWVSATSKDELTDRFKEALSVMPGVEFEFTQPIEMRFNELITGVRADVAIKIFGEDLGILQAKANEIKDLIEDVEGASDISVEKVAGLPQISVKYNRQKLAKYNMNVADLNQIISIGFGGLPAGSIFEGEKRFDFTVKLGENFRRNIDNLQNLYVDLPASGSELTGVHQIPLRELAEISFTKGPAKISRDNTQRRIVVGINVRNRDMESVVEDVQKLIEENIDFPTGYSISYGGQFENLRSAKQRLMIAIPVALLLIFILLHFALHSFKEAAMVFSAIPLATVGGVLLLWIRGLPFSISAGVGFIALFGIAVLNGLVLIEHFKDLKKLGIKNINEIIIRGTTERIRPVLLTASAAALGFFPMAVSTSAGAEVQRPLATVVIGGLVTSTLLTLVVLPVLYSWLSRPKKEVKGRISPGISVLLLVGLFSITSLQTNAQDAPDQLELAIEIALKNNSSLKADALQAERSHKEISSAWNINKTELFYHYDENNIAANGYPIKVWGIQQSLEFPTVYAAQKSRNVNLYKMQENQYTMQVRELKKKVSVACNDIVYFQNKRSILGQLDSLYSEFARAASRRYELGETNYLERLTAESRSGQIQMQLSQIDEDILIAYREFYRLLETDSSIIISQNELTPIEINVLDTTSHPLLLYYKNAQLAAEAGHSVEKNRLLPDIRLQYFRGSNNYENARAYEGVQVGIGIPLFFGSFNSRIQSARLQTEIVNQQLDYSRNILNTRISQLRSEISKYSRGVQYYNETGRQLSLELYNTALRSYQEGEIDFLDYVITIEQAREIVLSYLDNVRKYNEAVLQLKYLNY